MYFFQKLLCIYFKRNISLQSVAHKLLSPPLGCLVMGVICCASFSDEYINLSLPAEREGKQVGEGGLVKKTNGLASLDPFQSLQTSSFITCLGTLTMLRLSLTNFICPLLM